MPDNKVNNAIEIEIDDDNGSSKEEIKQDTEQPENQAAYAETSQEIEEKPDYYDQYLRMQAELQNYKRRIEQRMQEWRLYAAKEIVSQLLPVIDDFEILFNHHREGTEEICVDGVKMIYNKLLSSLVELGLEPIEAEGKQFDPNLHEAVMAEESDEVEEGRVLKVWQRGFLYKDTLLRPAKVITAKAKKDDVKDG
ncbi:nucleotide exchange factor GrpE [candidate division KSB1 bacterium]|nr:nucleotide exchange factor GrpE [candidate division KSB1 bacterium]RQW00572.1 MAG: nucleotide exchange factor GrpE [candidate division KSB1 bacterium]